MRQTDYEHLKRNYSGLIQAFQKEADKFSTYIRQDTDLPNDWIEKFERLKTIGKNIVDVDRFIAAHEAGEDPEWPDIVIDLETPTDD